MRITTDGRNMPARWLKRFFRLGAKLRNLLSVTVELKDSGHTARFICDGLGDAYRPMTLWLKEEGTMVWLENTLKPGDIFLDIGANIGIYTVAAAHRVGETGRVYAFEPHKVNALSLMKNISASGLNKYVDIFSVALSDSVKMEHFHYLSLESASTASQLGEAKIPGSDELFNPLASEYIATTTIDQLINDKVIQNPTVIKIDVDGIELKILEGMQTLLSSTHKPRSIQVEMNVGEQTAIEKFMERNGYTLHQRHFTLNGKKLLQKGEDVANIAHNAIFKSTAV